MGTPDYHTRLWFLPNVPLQAGPRLGYGRSLNFAALQNKAFPILKTWWALVGVKEPESSDLSSALQCNAPVAEWTLIPTDTARHSEEGPAETWSSLEQERERNNSGTRRSRIIVRVSGLQGAFRR